MDLSSGDDLEIALLLKYKSHFKITHFVEVDLTRWLIIFGLLACLQVMEQYVMLLQKNMTI